MNKLFQKEKERKKRSPSNFFLTCGLELCLSQEKQRSYHKNSETSNNAVFFFAFTGSGYAFSQVEAEPGNGVTSAVRPGDLIRKYDTTADKPELDN